MSAIVVGGATPESLGNVREVTPSSRGRLSRLACSAFVLSWGLFVWIRGVAGRGAAADAVVRPARARRAGAAIGRSEMKA
jgi:hypothetical protein